MRGTMALSMAVTGMLAGCVAPPAPPPPPPPPPPAEADPAPAPPPADWRDAPLTPGAWRYGPGEASSEARFGLDGAPPLFVARCDRARRRVALMRPAPVATEAGLAFVVTTSTANRTLPAGSIAGAPGMIGALLSADDSVLDAMAFSRGRFV